MSKQPLAMSTEEIEDYVARIGLDDDMYFSLHADASERLTAAEQRNEVLVELLTEALGSVYVDAGKCENTQAWKETTELAARIEAALKPTESEQSNG